MDIELKKRKPSGREKDEASIKLLEKLRGQLYSSNSSTARRTAFTLSWMQEDGLEILSEALFSRAAKRTKNASAYGLRSMRGRMKKMALEVFRKGLKHADNNTRDVCNNSLSMIKEKTAEKPPSKRKKRTAKFEIKEIRGDSMKRQKMRRKGKRGHLLRDEDSLRK